MRPLVNELGRLQMGRLSGTLLVGVYITLRSSMNRRHGPFDFEDYSTFDAWTAIGGLALVLYAVFRMVPVVQRMRAVERRYTPEFLDRASMPKTIYELLLAVAAADGRIDPYERSAVETVMLRRLPDVVTKQDLKNWSTTVEPPRDPTALARRIVGATTEHERAALWEWCREVAAVDGTDDDEHDVLRQIRAVLKPTNFAAGLRR